MPRIPIVTIKKFHTILKSELPINAPLGRPIITTDTQEMFLGTGDTTPLIKINDVIYVDTYSNLTIDIGTIQKIYIVKDTNSHYYFYNNQYIKINGLGIIKNVKNYSDLPITNEVEGLFGIQQDETNGGCPSVYFYNKTTNIYNRMSFNNFQGNKILNFNSNGEIIKANNPNDKLNFKCGNNVHLQVVPENKEVFINQKMDVNVELEIKQYNINSGTKSSIPVALDGTTCVTYNDKIYCFGGRPSNPTNTIYTYDNVNGWVKLSAIIPANRAFMGSCVYNDKIYLFGGYNLLSSSYYTYADVYMFDPSTNTFTSKSPMNQKRHGLYSGLIGDKLWVIGGVYYTSTSSSTYADSKSIEYYDFTTDTWTLLPTSYNMPTPTYSGASFILDKEIHCIAGYSKTLSKYTDAHQVFNTETLTWSMKAVYPYSYVGLRGLSVNGLGYVAGGHPSDGLSTSKSLYIYVPKKDIWVKRYDMTTQRTNYSLVYYDNSIYAISGGYYWNNSGYSAYSRTTEVEAYTPIYDTESKDFQVILRTPQVLGTTTTVSNLINEATGEIGRLTTLENGQYWEYGDWNTNGKVEVLVKRFNY